MKEKVYFPRVNSEYFFAAFVFIYDTLYKEAWLNLKLKPL